MSIRYDPATRYEALKFKDKLNEAISVCQGDDAINFGLNSFFDQLNIDKGGDEELSTGERLASFQKANATVAYQELNRNTGNFLIPLLGVDTGSSISSSTDQPSSIHAPVDSCL